MNQHPKYLGIVQLLREGLSIRNIAATLHVDRRTIRQIRDCEGITQADRRRSLDDKLDLPSVPTGVDGHVKWTGRRDHGTPTIAHQGHVYSVAALIFTRRTGLKPAGQVRAECDFPQCVAPGHLADDLERRTTRLQMRALFLWDAPWSACPSGHGWEEYGRVEPDLTLYCKGCTSDRDKRLARNRVTQ